MSLACRAGDADRVFPSAASGLIALWRRPASRFGPLMVIAGFVVFAGTLQWTRADVPHTIGQAVDLLPPVLFLHVFLAFPSGRLEHRLDRCLVVAGYLTAIGFEFVEMALGGFGPDNLLEVIVEPGARQAAAGSARGTVPLCLFGIAALVARRGARHGRCAARWPC